MSEGRSLDEKKHQIEGLANAQTIRKTLEALEEGRTRFVSRWLYELIQNARDSFDRNRRLQIEVRISPHEIIFRHNGRPFSDEEILSLIVHGSTKRDLQDSPIRFGTGFISTHLLSRRVRVRGTLIGESVSGRFEFVLDRSGTTDKEILRATDVSYKEFKASLEKSGAHGSDWTEYCYRLDSTQIFARDVENQLSAIPFILAFDPRMSDVTIEILGATHTFTRRTDIAWPDGTPTTLIPLVAVERDGELLLMAVVGNDEAMVAVPISTVSDRKTLEILPPPDVASVFIFLPLLRTRSIGLPAAYHSQSFRPNEDRDGPLLEEGTGEHSTKNKELFDSCARLLVGLFKGFAEVGWKRLDRALLIHSPQDFGGWLADNDWYREYLRRLLHDISEIPLVERDEGDPISLARAAIPMTDETLSWRDALHFGADLLGDRVPSEDVSENCSRQIDGWIGIFPEADGRPFTPLNSSFLLKHLRDLGSLKGLWGALHPDKPFEEKLALDWLNRLIAAIPETFRKSALEDLLPNQEGAFKSYSTLSRDTGIADVLKDAHDGLLPDSESVRGQLLHSGLVGVEALIERNATLDEFLPGFVSLLKKRAVEPEAKGDIKFRSACLTTFRWLVKNKRWSEFRDSLPTFASNADGSETISKTSAKPPFPLIPKTQWPALAQEFLDAFPPGWVLVDDYAVLLEADDWQAVTREGLIIDVLVSSSEIAVTDSLLEESALHDLPEGNDHSVKAPAPLIQIGVLSQLKNEDFYNSLRSSTQRAARFLRFVLQYVAAADSSWTRREFIECECGNKHEIIPCEWMIWIRHNRWVPRRRRLGATGEGAEVLTTESFARLASIDPKLSAVASSPGVEPLLSLLGINVLEQAVLSVDAARQADLRANLIQLARLEADEPGAIDEVVKTIEAQRLAGERWRNNQALGKVIEDLIETVLKEEFKNRDIRVQPNFVGYDRKLYTEGFVLFDEDVGYVDLRLPGIAARIEIKATKSDKISMSYQQGKESLNDPDTYWLCVVPLPDPLPLDRPLIEVVRDCARFVPRIADTLADSHAELEEAEHLATTSGFELQHVDQIRYGLTPSVWERYGYRLADFVKRVVQQVSPFTG